MTLTSQLSNFYLRPWCAIRQC